MSGNGLLPQGESLDYVQFVDRLKARRDTLPPRLQDVAQFVLNNPEEVAILTIVEIARAAKVPPSTVTRFTQELGLSRFADLQAIFRARLVGPRMSYADRMNDMSARAGKQMNPSDPQSVLGAFAVSAFNSLSQMVEDQTSAALSDFVGALRAAEVVHLCGGRGDFGVAAYCFYSLSAVGRRAALIDDLGGMRGQQLKAAGAGDAVVCIGFDDYAAETLEVARAAADRNLVVLAITDNELSPLVPLARHALFVRETQLGNIRSHVPAMVLCQALVASVGHVDGVVSGRK